MKPKLNYVPWKITVNKDHLERSEDSCEKQAPQEIHDGIQKWRRFPVTYGDTPQTADTVYVLLDRLPTPYSLLDPKHTQISRAEKISPSELPAGLRELYARLQQLGHAE